MMGGIITLVPLIGRLVAPVAGPLFRLTGSDPGMFPGMILANDMGAFPLAGKLAVSPEAAGLGGMILGSMLGVNIVFNIPVALGLIAESDRPFAARGFLYGFITVPVGVFCGGLAAGCPLPFILFNMIPVVIVSALLALLMRLIPDRLIRIFIGFGKFISLLALLGIVIAITAELAGFNQEKLNLESVETSLKTVGSIIIVLPGAYVLVELLGRIFRKAFLKAGARLAINETSVLGMIATLANNIPTFSMVKDMDERGKVLNFAFIAGASFTFGDHLGFCAAVAPDLIIPMITAKLSAAVCAVLLTLFLLRKRS